MEKQPILRHLGSTGLVVALAGAITGCSALALAAASGAASATTSGARTTSVTQRVGDATSVIATGPVNPAAIPLGDGYVSATPKIGYVDSCVTDFSNLHVGGAFVVGPWINETTKTWDSLKKVAVEGAVRWSSARYTVALKGASRVIATNDLPTDHTTGVFPVSPSDPAYSYDRNPNSIKAQSFTWTLPADPASASTPHCLGLGTVGVLNDGIVLFDALDGEGRDAGAHETLDNDQGHPQGNEIYHHHAVPTQVIAAAKGRSTLVGYALDGYGIYVERNANGTILTNTELDACHGRTSRVRWNGKVQLEYHYDATLEYPYTIGCFHGTASG